MSSRTSNKTNEFWFNTNHQLRRDMHPNLYTTFDIALTRTDTADTFT